MLMTAMSRKTAVSMVVFDGERMLEKRWSLYAYLYLPGNFD